MSKAATQQDTAVQQWLHSAESFGAQDAAEGAPWVRAVREQGVEAFKAQGFPHAKHEQWQESRVRSLIDQKFAPVSGDATATLEAARTFCAQHPATGNRVVFINGRFVPRLSLHDETDKAAGGFVVRPLDISARSSQNDDGDTLGQLCNNAGHPFAALNSAFLRDGLSVHASAGVQVTPALEVLFLSAGAGGEGATDGTAAMAHPRLVVNMAKGARGTIFVRYAALNNGGGARYFNNVVTECKLSAGAHLSLFTLTDEGPGASHMNQCTATCDTDASFTCGVVNTGGAWVRHEMHVTLSGKGAQCALSGLNLASQKQHMDTQVFIDHKATHCNSAQLFKGVFDDHASGVFSGKVLVRQHAQKTDARQLNRNLLLSKQAQAHTRPQLEILADDVKCTHGATVGQLQEDALFYMRSRGIDTRSARRLLTWAFASDTLSGIRDPAILSVCEKRVKELLQITALEGR